MKVSGQKTESWRFSVTNLLVAAHWAHTAEVTVAHTNGLPNGR